jgi:hypothetical protein
MRQYYIQNCVNYQFIDNPDMKLPKLEVTKTQKLLATGLDPTSSYLSSTLQILSEHNSIVSLDVHKTNDAKKYSQKLIINPHSEQKVLEFNLGVGLKDRKLKKK